MDISNDTSDIEDLAYQLYVLDKISKGRNDVHAGRVVTAAQLKQEMKSW
jgi:predicted transcriptional regulator